MYAEPEASLLAALSALDEVAKQNALMRVPDRELAISLLGLNDEDRETVLSSVARRKAFRVEAEQRYVERLNMSRKDRKDTVLYVLRCLQAVQPGRRSYIRPRGRGAS